MINASDGGVVGISLRGLEQDVRSNRESTRSGLFIGRFAFVGKG
jgi:hypothetical protein